MNQPEPPQPTKFLLWKICYTFQRNNFSKSVWKNHPLNLEFLKNLFFKSVWRNITYPTQSFLCLPQNQLIIISYILAKILFILTILIINLIILTSLITQSKHCTSKKCVICYTLLYFIWYTLYDIHWYLDVKGIMEIKECFVEFWLAVCKRKTVFILITKKFSEFIQSC